MEEADSACLAVAVAVGLACLAAAEADLACFVAEEAGLACFAVAVKAGLVVLVVVAAEEAGLVYFAVVAVKADLVVFVVAVVAEAGLVCFAAYLDLALVAGLAAPFCFAAVIVDSVAEEAGLAVLVAADFA